MIDFFVILEEGGAILFSYHYDGAAYRPMLNAFIQDLFIDGFTGADRWSVLANPSLSRKLSGSEASACKDLEIRWRLNNQYHIVFLVGIVSQEGRLLIASCRQAIRPHFRRP